VGARHASLLAGEQQVVGQQTTLHSHFAIDVGTINQFESTKQYFMLRMFFEQSNPLAATLTTTDVTEGTD
jgi:hypothetical protein